MRRRSGGGTVFHDAGNLNYSVIVPNSTSKGAGSSFKRSTHAEMVVRAIAAAKGELARDLELRSPGSNVRVNERHDIVMDASKHLDRENGTLKISGSAFKLTRDRALHHGTLLFGSPNLHCISGLLRSPARDFIVAKGVQSVRSPVGNLFGITSDEERDYARKALERSIVREFRRMYKATNTAREATTVDEDITDESTLEASLTDPAHLTEAIPSGAAELSSPSWLFEQTPGFIFSTQPLPSEPAFAPPSAPHEVSIQVKNGIAQASAAPAPLSHLGGRKLHEVRDWHAVLGERNGKALAAWLEALFPPLPVRLGHEAAAAAAAAAAAGEPLDAVVDEKEAPAPADQVMRKRDEGTLEVERDGEQTVRDVVSSKEHPTKRE